MWIICSVRECVVVTRNNNIQRVTTNREQSDRVSNLDIDPVSIQWSIVNRSRKHWSALERSTTRLTFSAIVRQAAKSIKYQVISAHSVHVFFGRLMYRRESIFKPFVYWTLWEWMNCFFADCKPKTSVTDAMSTLDSRGLEKCSPSWRDFSPPTGLLIKRISGPVNVHCDFQDFWCRHRVTRLI